MSDKQKPIITAERAEKMRTELEAVAFELKRQAALLTLYIAELQAGAGEPSDS